MKKTETIVDDTHITVTEYATEELTVLQGAGGALWIRMTPRWASSSEVRIEPAQIPDLIQMLGKLGLLP